MVHIILAHIFLFIRILLVLIRNHIMVISEREVVKVPVYVDRWRHFHGLWGLVPFGQITLKDRWFLFFLVSDSLPRVLLNAVCKDVVWEGGCAINRMIGSCLTNERVRVESKHLVDLAHIRGIASPGLKLTSTPFVQGFIPFTVWDSLIRKVFNRRAHSIFILKCGLTTLALRTLPPLAKD